MPTDVRILSCLTVFEKESVRCMPLGDFWRKTALKIIAELVRSLATTHWWNFSSPLGGNHSNSLFLFLDKPVSSMKIFKVAGEPEESAVIACRVWAFPRPSFLWFFNGRRLIGDGQTYETNSTTYPGDEYEAVLRILDVKPADYGVYSCRSENELGVEEIDIEFQRPGLPDTPSLPPAALERGSTWLLLTWEAGFDGGMKDTNYIISAVVSSHSDADRVFNCKRTNPCNITGLEQQTTYILRVSPLNEEYYNSAFGVMDVWMVASVQIPFILVGSLVLFCILSS